MRSLVFGLLAAVALVAGCGADPAVPASTPERPVLAPTDLYARVSLIGDAFTGGSAMGGHGKHGWPVIAATQLRAEGIDIKTVIGVENESGYAQRGPKYGSVFADQVPRVVRPNDRLVVLLGSSSDELAPPELLAPAIQRTLADAMAAAPSAKLLVIGPLWVQPGPPPEGILRVRDTVRAQAEAVGALFVDPIAEAWFVDRPDLIGSDGVHPTNDGNKYMADKIAPYIAQQLR